MENGLLVNGLGLLNDFDILRSDLSKVPQEQSVGITLQPAAQFPGSRGFSSKVDPYILLPVQV